MPFLELDRRPSYGNQRATDYKASEIDDLRLFTHRSINKPLYRPKTCVHLVHERCSSRVYQDLLDDAENVRFEIGLCTLEEAIQSVSVIPLVTTFPVR